MKIQGDALRFERSVTEEQRKEQKKIKRPHMCVIAIR